MKDHVFVKIWNVIYPIFIYYVISNVVMALAVMALGVTGNNYDNGYTMLQTIATAVSLPVLYGFYRKDQLFFTVFHQRVGEAYKEMPSKRRLVSGLLSFFFGALAGVVLNHIISATGLTEASRNYQAITEHFFAGGFFFEILGIGILVPIVEELLYRGIVYGRLSDWVGIPMAAAISALIFGGLHLNVVQFIYAGLMGILMVFILEATHSLWGAALAHIGANLFTVLRVETGILQWMEKSRGLFWTVTFLMAAVCALMAWRLYKNGNRRKLL